MTTGSVKSTDVMWAIIGLAIPLASGSLSLIGWFDYALLPTLFVSILCPTFGVPIVVANLGNIVLGRTVAKRGTRSYWLTNWLSVTSVLSGVYLSAHVVFTAFLVELGLHC